MNPDIDLKQHWHISPKTIIPFEGQGTNPFKRKNHKWIINNQYFLKSFSSEELSTKEKERHLLTVLQHKGIPVLLPLPRKIIPAQTGYSCFCHYQLFPYVPQENNGHLSYPLETGQAVSLANTLTRISQADPDGPATSFFSVQAKVSQAKKMIRTNQESIANTARHTFQHLENTLFPFLPYFNTGFCHGDFHPANILWKNQTVSAIVDWEAAHRSEELYDLAFFLGCVGMDSPEELSGKGIQTLIKIYFQKTKSGKLAFDCLPELILATRFQWLAVWLAREEDADLAVQEITFWKWLQTHRDRLQSQWQTATPHNFKYSANQWVFQDQSRDADIRKAKERLAPVNLFGHTLIWELFQPVSQLATDLRLLAIDAGMQGDIRQVIQLLQLQKALAQQYPCDAHLKIEQAIILGNAVLVFSQFHMVHAAEAVKMACECLIQEHSGIPELKIGYAILLRNLSILYGECGNNKPEIVKTRLITSLLDELRHLSEQHPTLIPIKEELARALANAVTTLLGKSNNVKDIIADYANRLESLYTQYPTNRKIKGAYQITQANVKKTKR